MHFLHDIASSDEFAFDVDLGYGWPVAVFLDMLSKFIILKDINILEFLYSVKLEDLSHIITEATSWHLSGSLHEQSNIILSNPLGYLFIDFI